MQMGHDPENRGGERDHEHDEKQAAFAALFAERARAAVIPEIFGVALVLERHRNIEAVAAFAGAAEKFFLLLARRFRSYAWCVLDQPMKVLHLLAQFVFALREFLLLLVQRSA